MTAKQLMGITAPDESKYITVTDGNGNTITVTKTSGSHKTLEGEYAPDGSRYVTLTDGNGNLG